MANEVPNLGSVVTSPTIRKVIYGAYVVSLVIAGATSAGFAITQDGNPEALNVVNAVLLYLGIPVGGLAIANAPTTKQVEVIQEQNTEEKPVEGFFIR